MNETQPIWHNLEFWLGLFVAVAVIVYAVVFRGSKLKGLNLKAGKLNARVETHEPRSVKISGIKQRGERHLVQTERDDTDLGDIEQHGKGHKVIAKK